MLKIMIIHDNQRCCEFCSAVLKHNSCLKSCVYHNSDMPWVLFSSPFNTICLKSCLYHNSITSPISQFYYSKMSKAIYRDGGKTYSTLCHILAKVNSHHPPPPHTPQTVQNTDIIIISIMDIVLAETGFYVYPGHFNFKIYKNLPHLLSEFWQNTSTKNKVRVAVARSGI